MQRLARALAVCGFAAFAACSGGGGSRSIPNLPGQPPTSSNARVTFKLLIPAAASTPAIRKRAFVSASTAGVSVTTYAHADVNHATPLSVTTTDVSGSSSACSTVSTVRTCTVPVDAPAGDDDFVFALFDAAPVDGAIPGSAHELGIATATQNIIANTANSITAPVSGIIAGFGAATPTMDFGADGHAHVVALVIAPTDFDNKQITAGTANAPFQNPITASVAESGGSSQVTLSLNGGAATTQVTITKATDAVTATYAGGGAAGYHATVGFSAPAFAGESATQQNLILNRSALAVSNPTIFYSPQPAQLNTYPAGQHVLAITDPGAAAGTEFTATPSGCSGILSVGTPVGTGTASSLFVAAGATISSGGCTITIGDGTATYTVDVTSALRPAPAVSPVMTEYPIGASGPTGIATGADGNLWFTECSAPAISSIKPNGSSYSQHLTTAHGISNPQADVLGPDGNIWFGDNLSATVDNVTPSGAFATYPVGNTGTNWLTAGLDGNVWFDELNGSTTGGTIGNVNPSTGAFTAIEPAFSMVQGVAVGPDGNIWFAGNGDGYIGTVQSGVASEFTASSVTAPYSLTTGSDGNLWFTTANVVGNMSKSGVILSQYTVPNSGSAIVQFITAGPDGALWFADKGNSTIVRMTTSGAFASYATTTPGAAPYGITVGPDGNIWFTEQGSGNIGVIPL